MRSISALALAASLSVGSATYQGFNYASTKPDGSIMELQDWTDAFSAQVSLSGTDGGFTSARLYTMIKDSSASTPEPILALQAAHDDGKTSLLLGLWCSAGQAGVDKEIAALQAAIKQFPNLGPQIAGISVGSEDLYRNSNIANRTDLANKDKPDVTPLGPGVNPDVMLSYVKQVIGNLTGVWSGIPVGHVDTWTAFTNDDGSFNQNDLTELIKSLDFLGVDSYPYFQSTMPNDISVSTNLFTEAYQKVLSVAGDAEVWITETGWPSSGDTENLAVASVDNAQTYWQSVGCSNFGKINTWWYTFYDATETPSFGVVKSLTGGSTTWDLSCAGHTGGPDAAVALASNSTTSSSISNGTSSSQGLSSDTATKSGSSSTKTGSSQPSAAGLLTVSSFLAFGGALVALIASR